MGQAGKSLDPFAKECFSGIKGYLAISILVHHLYLFTAFFSNTSIGDALYQLGHFGVVCFFFLSGFGLFSSYKTKGEVYVKSLLLGRIIPFYLSYLFVVAIYTAYNLLMHNPISANLMIRSLTYGGTIVNFGWYFQTALLMYILFYVLKLLIKDDVTFIAILGTIILAFIFLYYFFISSEKTEYEPTFSFFVGIVFAHVYHRKGSLFAHKPALFTAIGLAAFLSLAAFSTMYNFRYNDYQWVACKSDFIYLLLMMVTDLALIFFMTACIAFVGKTAPCLICNPFSRFLGKHSLEIYGLQGLFLCLLDDKIGNRVIYATVAVMCIIASSLPVHQFLYWVKRWVSKCAPKQSC